MGRVEEAGGREGGERECEGRGQREVMANNKQINPMSLKLPSGTKLAGKDLARFRTIRRAIEERLDRMPSSTLIAQAPAR